MIQARTEQEWVTKYIQGKKHPLPVVLGTKGTWTGNGKPMVILIGFTIEDVLVLGDIYGVSHHPVREMKEKQVTYYAINIIDRKKVKEIIEEWKKP
ncbi:hypothetical protein [Niallia endozanthoxylica]|uniref:LAGLIDADG homing endonuclease n=1 Tax=Niallia endozanthoxylica TaxID=2036016 RepID=A0A5J5GWY8_9BACI|nr:hypothetical protein [Niallia endozanthoxylica]KAA9012527.1 hypothetical protein F4V44_25570 [Niallia endozanthoxylica]